MRNIPNRKLNREPVRSPSPDIANRNIIVHTSRPQTSQIFNKSRTKYSDSAKSQIQRNLIETQQKYRELQKQLTLLLIENSNIKKQNYELKDLLSKNKPMLKSYEQKQYEASLKQYQTRFTSCSYQIKRIQQLLIGEKQRNRQLQGKIAGLKKYDLVYSSKFNKNIDEELPYNNLRLIQSNLNEQFEKIKAEHQLRVHLSLNAINQRLGKIERSQSNIKNTVRPQYHTPKAEKQHDKYDYSTASQYITNSNELKKFSRSGKQTEEQRQIDLLRDKLRLNQLQYESVKKQNQKLTVQIQSQRGKSNLVGDCHRCKLYQIRITELERELEMITLLKNQVTSLQVRVEQLVRENTELKNMDELNKLYKTRIEWIQSQKQNETYQSDVIRRQQKLNFNLQDYLRRIKDVKNILNNQEFSQFLQKINLLVTQNTHLQSQLTKLIQQNQRNPKQNKNRQIELRLQVSQLKRQNYLLKVQNQYQKQQIQELRQIVYQQIRRPFQQHISFQTQLQQIESVQPQVAKFKFYLSQAISRLQSMQNSVNMML